MESMSRFEININYSDCETVYDYGERKWMSKPERGWDVQSIEKFDHLDMPLENENFQTQIGLMDDMFGDKRFFEKAMKKSDGEESPVGSHQSSRTVPVYKAGDVIRGTLVIESDKPINAEKLVLKATGKAFVKIRVYHGKGYYDDIGKEHYMKEEAVFWHKAKKERKSLDESSLLDCSQALPASDRFPPGRHELPFEFKIPLEARTSCPPLIISSHNKAYLCYRLKALLVMEGKLTKNIMTTQGLWVNNVFDIAKNPKSKEVIRAEHILKPGLFVKTGQLRCIAKLEAGAFLRGSVIPLKLEVENMTDTEIASTTARVILSGRARAGTGKLRVSQSINHKAIKKVHGAVAAKTVEVISLDLPLDFSHCSVDSNLIPAGNMEDCTLIDMKYEIDVELKRKGMHRNLDFRIPIDIGTENNSVF